MAGEALRTAEDINRALSDSKKVGCEFEFTGAVQYYYSTNDGGRVITLKGQDGRIEFIAGRDLIHSARGQLNSDTANRETAIPHIQSSSLPSHSGIISMA